MQSVYAIRSNLSPYIGKSTVLVKDHNVDDIIDALQTRQIKYAPEFDKISNRFWKGTAEASAREVYDFLKRYIKYRIEPDTDQTVRWPQVLLAMGHGDCKHYAQFINGIMASLKRKGYPVGECYYRYAGYNPMTGDLHHVFAVLKQDGKEIWIDPVLPTFNNRKQYFVKQDKKASSMPLREISGVDVGNIFDDIKKGAQNTVNKVQQTVKQVAHGQQVNLQNIAKGTANTIKKADTAVKKVAHGQQVNLQNLGKGVKITAKNVATGTKNTFDASKKAVLKLNPLSLAGRNAFLALLKVNAFNMAHRLYDFIHKSKANEQELYNTWTNKAGGDNNKLKTAITQGMQGYLARNKQTMAAYNQQHGLSGVKYYHDPNAVSGCYQFPYYVAGVSDGYKNAVGLDPATLTALMTAASLVIALLSPFLKRGGWSAQDQANSTAAIDTGAAVLSTIAAGNQNTGAFIDAGMVVGPDGQLISTAGYDITPGPTGPVVTPVIPDPDDMPYNYVDINPNSPGGSFTDDLKEFGAEIKDFWTYNKKPILVVTGLVLAWKAGVFTKTHKVTRRGK